MLTFRDFVPRDNTPMLALSRRHESMQDVLARVNAWVASDRIEVVNIETVLLPASATTDRQGGSAGSFTDNLQLDLGAFEIGGSRVQVLRVWHRAAD
jgi:hypothetical protein